MGLRGQVGIVVAVVRKPFCKSNRSSKIDSYFDQIAVTYPSHRFLASTIRLVYLRQTYEIKEAITALRRSTESLSILDWGCGKGHISYLLNNLGLSVTSCDIVSGQSDSTFHQEVPILVDLGAQVVPLNNPALLPFPDRSFDAVTSFGVLEHVENDEASAREIRRILEDDGLFYCSFLPYRWSWTQRLARLTGDNYHDRLYTKRQVRNLFARAGFEIQTIRHEQLFPKNIGPKSFLLEAVDNFLCKHTPLKYLATNLVFVASPTTASVMTTKSVEDQRFNS